MPDLRDGESAEMKGSASRPYVLKNIGGIYSCSCPAWRNQSLPIERRSCKHLCAWRGRDAETARVGGDAPTQPICDTVSQIKTTPPLLLAENWDRSVEPTGWLISEKLDGVRGFWTGERILSRLGNTLHAPAWFTAGLPKVPLDGELWLARKAFQRTVSIVRRQDQTDLWKQVRFLVFDAPDEGTPFEERLATVQRILRTNQPTYAQAHVHYRCLDADHLRRELAKVEALGGEGLMLRQPGSLYEAGRSSTLLKVKNFASEEARVVGHEPGKGRHKGRLGALLVELANGMRFAVGTGLSDAERANPPANGSTITFGYQELTDGGVPRFPTYVGNRTDAIVRPFVPQPTRGDSIMPRSTVQTSTKRRFEYVKGNSDKFWEVAVAGVEVTVCYGRNGTDGQTNTKSLPDANQARQFADKVIAQKTKKGYIEVR